MVRSLSYPFLVILPYLRMCLTISECLLPIIPSHSQASLTVSTMLLHSLTSIYPATHVSLLLLSSHNLLCYSSRSPTPNALPGNPQVCSELLPVPQYSTTNSLTLFSRKPLHLYYTTHWPTLLLLHLCPWLSSTPSALFLH